MEQHGDSFKDRVITVIMQIPRGRVMTYGQIAALCGSPRSARIVGGIAHFGDPGVPWQRVVNRSGGLAAGYPGGKNGHREALEAEGVMVNAKNLSVNLQEIQWRP